MSNILVILADGFEEAEAIVTIDVLRRLKFNVCVTSLNEGLEVLSIHEIKIIADKKLSDCKNEKFDAIVLPGGMPGASNLKNSDDVIQIVQKAHTENAFVCAICAAPIVLSKAGILDDTKFTAYPGFERYFKTLPSSSMVVKDKNIITAKGPGAAFGFALEIANALGENTSQLEDAMFLR